MKSKEEGLCKVLVHGNVAEQTMCEHIAPPYSKHRLEALLWILWPSPSVITYQQAWPPPPG